MIYFSYFARAGNNPNAVSIARYSPKFFKGPVDVRLAPPSDIIKLEDEQEFRQQYQRRVLDRIDVHQIAQTYDGKIFLCYESSEKFCHRKCVMEWLQEAGYEVQEIGGCEHSEPQPPKPEQLDLF